ncbi:dihydroneopterin aldolase [Venturia nashicola]|uniref:dihydroneopterin aldolase n=1 Tax=Venturia nashicola TaxID=86259 RepID=A0A4Z1P0D0_9PEZI|nr:dihydroneopterin aldolase [Venturia nashicola]TLD34916.1 dihydroneopterin aldolase [Venturia nashicola]
MATATNDAVFIRNVSIEAVVGLDGWGRPKPQPVLLSVRIPYPRHSIEAANVSDNISDCLDYRVIYKALRTLDHQTFEGIFQLADKVARQIEETGDGPVKMEVTVLLPNGLVQSEGVSAHLHLSPKGAIEAKYYEIHKMVIPCILGIGDHERPRKQPVVVDVKLDRPDFLPTGLKPDSTLEYERIFQNYEASEFFTLEKLVTNMAGFILRDLNTPWTTVTVSAEKPVIFAFARGPGVEITRTVDDFARR